MNQTFLSILVTNYNKENWIQRCLKSVFEQTYQNFELFIVDDASTDSSLEKIHELAIVEKPNVKLIQLQENKGMANAYNLMLAQARGDIVCLLDSDDFWYPNKLARVIEHYSQHPTAVLHQHKLDIHRGDVFTNDCPRKYLLSGDLLQYMIDTKRLPLFMPTSGLSFQMDVIKKVLPIPLSFHKTGEAFLTRTVCCYGEVISTLESLGGYGVDGTNAWFENDYFDVKSYSRNILIPELNAFYRAKGIPMEFPVTARSEKSLVNNFFDISLRTIFRKLHRMINKQ